MCGWWCGGVGCGCGVDGWGWGGVLAYKAKVPGELIKA